MKELVTGITRVDRLAGTRSAPTNRPQRGEVKGRASGALRSAIFREICVAIAEIIVQIFIIFLAAKAVGELALRTGQPPVVWEILIGILIGPHGLGLIGLPGPALIETLHNAETATEVLHTALEVFAEVGVIILLFVVGLETRLSDILQVGGRAALVATGGMVLPFAFGYAYGLAIGEPALTALFLATALVATSIGITARVLEDLGRLQTQTARIILGAAVIDDIVGMLVLAVASGLAAGTGLSLLSTVILALEAIGFTVFVVITGTHVIRQYSVHLRGLRLRNAPLMVALALCLGLAALAAQIGLAAIIGAFLAGMVFAEAREREELEHQARPVYDFFVPFFFVMTGTQVDPALFLDRSLVAFALVLTALAVFAKLVGAGLGAIGLGRRTMLTIGVGMVPRGEVGIIVAGIGQATGAISNAVFSAVVIMSVVTTLVAPPALKLLLSNGDERDKLPPPGAEHEGSEGQTERR